MRRRRAARVALASLAVVLGLVPVLVVTALPALAVDEVVYEAFDGTGPVAGTVAGGFTWAGSDGLVKSGGRVTKPAADNAWSKVFLPLASVWEDEFTMIADVYWVPRDGNGNEYMTLIFRANAAMSSYYAWYIACNGGNSTYLVKTENGVDTTLSSPLNPGMGCGGHYVLALEVVGQVFRLSHAACSETVCLPDQLIQEVTDPTFTPAGRSTSGFGMANYSSPYIPPPEFEGWWVQREAPDASVGVPDYRCGRTIRNVGGGQYFVDLEAFDLYPVNTGEVGGGDFVGYTDSSFGWRLSWSGAEVGANINAANTGVPAKNTLALPPLSEMPAGGWSATFHVLRTTHENTSGTWSNLNTGSFKTMDEDGGGTAKAIKPFWVPEPVWAAWSSMPASWRQGTTIGPTGATYAPGTDQSDQFLAWVAIELRGGDGLPLAAPTEVGWESAWATCTVQINPVDARRGHGVVDYGRAAPGGWLDDHDDDDSGNDDDD